MSTTARINKNEYIFCKQNTMASGCREEAGSDRRHLSQAEADVTDAALQPRSPEGTRGLVPHLEAWRQQHKCISLLVTLSLFNHPFYTSKSSTLCGSHLPPTTTLFTFIHSVAAHFQNIFFLHFFPKKQHFFLLSARQSDLIIYGL